MTTPRPKDPDHVADSMFGFDATLARLAPDELTGDVRFESGVNVYEQNGTLVIAPDPIARRADLHVLIDAATELVDTARQRIVVEGAVGGELVKLGRIHSAIRRARAALERAERRRDDHVRASRRDHEYLWSIGRPTT